jgi:hypothetical protein
MAVRKRLSSKSVFIYIQIYLEEAIREGQESGLNVININGDG